MQDDEIGIEQYILIIKRRSWILYSILGITVIFSLIYYFKSPPLYRNSASILIRQQNVSFFEPMYTGKIGSEVTDHTLLLKSNRIMSMVAESFTADELEKAKFSNKKEVMDRLIGDIKSNNITIEPIRNSNIIKIVATERNPYRSYYFPNKIAEAYQRFDIDSKKRQSRKLRNFAEEQLSVMKEALRKSEEALKNYKKKHLILGTSQETDALIDKTTDFEAKYREATVDRNVLEKRLSETVSRLDDEQKRRFETRSDAPQVQNLWDRLTYLENKKADLIIQGVDKKDSRITDLEGDIKRTANELRQKLSELLSSGSMADFPEIQTLFSKSLELKVEVMVARAKENAYKRIVQEYERKMEAVPDQEVKLARLERERDANKKIYMMLLEKSEEARISEASEIGDVTILDRAAFSNIPLKSVKMRNVIIFLFLGILLGIGMTIFIDYLDMSVKSEDEASRILGIPGLAIIPKINGKSTRKCLLLFKEQPNSTETESFRMLRTNLTLSSADKPLKTILITSPGEGEGKSMVSVNLAYSFYFANKKVLLVDSDMRKPAIHNFFNVELSPGLSDIITGNSIKDIIHNIDGVDVITAGTLPPNPAELLDSKKMEKLLESWKQKYDIIILDSPPFLSVSDATVLSKIVDGLLFVTAYGETRRQSLERLKTVLKNLNIQASGFVMNKVNVRKEYGYYHYRYYY